MTRKQAATNEALTRYPGAYAQLRRGRCVQCITVWHWVGFEKLKDSQCPECGTALKHATRHTGGSKMWFPGRLMFWGSGTTLASRGDGYVSMDTEEFAR